jgi:hypothetical protein
MGECREVYVALLDEGTKVWRPVAADPVEPGLFRLLGPVPDNEVWQFSPGEVVLCESRTVCGSVVLVAVERGRPELSAGAQRSRANPELIEWLGVSFADFLVYLAVGAVLAMFFVSDPTADVVLAVLAVGLSIMACPIGMRRHPKLSRFTNVAKLVSYPGSLLFVVGVIVVHYVWFKN